MGSCYKHVNDYVQDCTGIVLEIGSDRYEGSSAYFAELADQYNKDFVTIDLDENMPRRLKQCIPKHLQDRVTFIQCDGTEWTKTCIRPISILYLDNFDWDWEVGTYSKMIEEQRVWYTERGIEMNNINSQVAHLTQMQNLLPCMTRSCVVCLDDTYIHNGVYIGKGGAVVPYLLANNFKLELAQDYGVIMSRTK